MASKNQRNQKQAVKQTVEPTKENEVIEEVAEPIEEEVETVEEKPTVEVTEEKPVTEPVPAVEEVETLISFLNKRHPGLAITENTLPNSVKVVVKRLEAYSTAMGNRAPVNSGIIRENQLSLLQTFLTALDAKNNESFLAMDVISYFFDKNESGAFNQRLLFRDINVLGLPSTTREILENLSFLFVNICNPAKKRQFLNKTGISRYVNGLSPEYANNLARYVQI